MADEQAPKILIVDDDSLTASWLRARLEREG
jgi:DNA-binding response OmpR family regulator